MYFFILFVNGEDEQMAKNLRSACAVLDDSCFTIIDIKDDKNHDLVHKHDIKKTPTIVFEIYGKEFGKIIGFKSSEAIVNNVKELLK